MRWRSSLGAPTGRWAAPPAERRLEAIDRPRLLFVCTANINRSPMAATLLRQRLAEAGFQAEISSAGVLEPGHPASPHAVATLAARGIDLSAHRTRRLSADIVLEADLVLGMERRHVRAAAVLAPGALARTYTLKELIRRALDVGQRRPNETLTAWLDRVGRGRNTAALARDDERDTVADPIGGSGAEYEACAEELDLLVRGLRYLIWEGTRLPEPVDNARTARVTSYSGPWGATSTHVDQG